MKKDNKNKELYNKILNSESNEELDKIKITVNAYRDGDVCFDEYADFGALELPVVENEQNPTDGSPYTQFFAGAIDGPRALTVSLPGWVTMSLSEITDWDYVYDVYLNTQVPSFESAPALPGSTSYRKIVHSGNWSLSPGTCVGYVLFSIDDANEAPGHSVTFSNHPICIDEDTTEALVGCIDVLDDPDKLNKELRYITNVTVAGEHAAYFSISNFTPGYTDDGVSFCLRLNNIQGAVAAGLSTLNVQTVIHNGIADEDFIKGWGDDGQDTNTVYGTANHSIGLSYGNSIQIPGFYQQQYGVESATEIPSFTIPSGLTLSGTDIFVGYRGGFCTPVGCGAGIADGIGVEHSLSNNNSSDDTVDLRYNGGVGPGEVPIGTLLDVTSPQFVSGLSSYSGTAYVNAYYTNPDQASTDQCCPLIDGQVITRINISNTAPNPYHTGIGPNIPFTGGINKVEGSYFISFGETDVFSHDSAGTRYIAAIPNDTGVDFNSNDNSFFVYTVGQTGLIKATHPTQTGIVEAAGFSRYLAIRYKNTSANKFYKYDIATTGFTEVTTSLSSIERIITVRDQYSSNNNRGRFWILGTDESVLYDPISNNQTSVDHRMFTGVYGIPHNIDVFNIPNFVDKQPDSEIVNCQPYDDSNIPQYGNLIFPVNTGYGPALDHFPLQLDVRNAQLVAKTENVVGISPIQAGTSFFSGISLSGYRLDSHLNYRADLALVQHALVASVFNTGTNHSELLAFNLDFPIGLSGSIVDSYVSPHLISRYAPTSGTYKRVCKTSNELILWAPTSTDRPVILLDVYGRLNDNDDPVVQKVVTGIKEPISVVKSAHRHGEQFRTCLLNDGGNTAYTINDYDYTIQKHTFVSGLTMGHYSDIALATGSMNNRLENFVLMPRTTYETNTISGSLAVLSTTTTPLSSISFANTGIDETVISLAPSQVTTGEIFIGSITFTDDEFVGTNTFSANEVLGSEIFKVSGTNVYVKSGIALDHETTTVMTGVITGVDPYVGGVPFVDTFLLTINDVNEPPTDITLSPSSGKIASNFDLATQDYPAAIISLSDVDEFPFDNNDIDIAAGINKQYFKISNDKLSLLVKAGSVLQPNADYTVTVLAKSTGTTEYTAAKSFTLNVAGHSPISLNLFNTTATVKENIPSNLLPTLTTFDLTDPDGGTDNEVIITGIDSTFFNVSYNAATNAGTLSVANGYVFDYETRNSYTGFLVGRIIGTTAPIVRGVFTLNIEDVLEPSGIIFTPSARTINETSSTVETFLSTLTIQDQDNFAGDDLVITNLAFTTGGVVGDFRGALDPFWVFDNSTTDPDLKVLADRALDFETQNQYFIVASGHPSSSPATKLGGQFALSINDMDEAPTVSLQPTGTSINETTDTSLGRFKVADIYVQDETQSEIQLSLAGIDGNKFTIVPSSVITDNPTESVLVGSLFFNSGVQLDYNTKPFYDAVVVAKDLDAFSPTNGLALSGTADFRLAINDVPTCTINVEGSSTDVLCPLDTDGSVSLNITYTGDGASICSIDKPLSVSWQNLPTDADTSVNGFFVNGLGTGTYTANILGGSIPITSVQYQVNSPAPISITQVVLNNEPCASEGSIHIGFTGGQPPYIVSYGTQSVILPSGSGFVGKIPVTVQSSGNVSVRDANNCLASGSNFTFNFPNANPQYNIISKTPPAIHDSFLQDYKFTLLFGEGPHRINIYSSTTGEKGNVITSIDEYDTTVIESLKQPGSEIFDSSGNQIGIQLSQDLNSNPIEYSYDIGSQIYPGSYVFEFVNQDNCTFLTDVQTAENIIPLSAELITVNDFPLDIGTQVLSQPILDTLFIPYRMLISDSEVLSYISNITERSDIRLEIGNQIFDRKAIYGSVNCDTHSLVNIKFFGFKNNEWFFTIPFYKGFDISDTSEVDILNENISLVISDSKKIKIDKEYNNNVGTIKLLKGSVLTTDLNLSQFKNDKDITLSRLLSDGTFEELAMATVGDKVYLQNKHIAGSIFMIDFLKNTQTSEDLRTNDISSVSFDCRTNQKAIANNYQFLNNLNNFDLLDSLYVKRSGGSLHGGFLTLLLSGGYPDYIISYKYYDQETKSLVDLRLNNESVDNKTFLESIKPGAYIVKITDQNGNKLKAVNDTPYDNFYSKMIDFIINDLHTDTETLNFKHGDLLINIYDSSKITNPPPAIPSFPPQITPTPPTVDIPTVTTTTHEVSPNTIYTNELVIQTDPVKVKFTVSGPLGYKKTFSDRVKLIQMPAGVYTIEGNTKDLYNKYLYQDKRRVFINPDTKVLSTLNFESYKDSIIIDGSSDSSSSSSSSSY